MSRITPLTLGAQLGLHAMLPLLTSAGSSSSAADRRIVLGLLVTGVLPRAALLGALLWPAAALLLAMVRDPHTAGTPWRRLGLVAARGADTGYCAGAMLVALMSAMWRPTPDESDLAWYAAAAVVLGATLLLPSVRSASRVARELRLVPARPGAPPAHVSTPTTPYRPSQPGTEAGPTRSTAAEAAEGAQLWMQ